MTKMVNKQPQTNNLTSKISLNSVNILGVNIISTSLGSVLAQIIENEVKSCVIFTPNPEFLVEAGKNKEFKDILNKADINIPDGIGLVWASKFLGSPVAERISGADLVEKLLGVGNERKWEVGISGMRRGVVSESTELVERLSAKYPFIKFTNLDDPKLKIENCKLKIVLACQGMIKQEKWILENKEKIDAKIFMGVGGSLDFLTGFTKRAPRWMQRLGLEWLYRGLHKPAHFKRIWKAVIVFPWLVIKEKIRNSNIETRNKY